MCVCMNCDQLHSHSDTEVANLLTKIRLKTKSLANHYLLSMRQVIVIVVGSRHICAH